MPMTVLSGDTKLMLLIADPVASAKSPLLVNSLLAQRNQLGEYALVPLATPKLALSNVISALREVHNFCGAIVSMPHKSTIAPLLDELSAEARLTGVVNVIRREPSGRFAGTCLDGEGMVAGLRANGHVVRGKSCLLLGAGGAASAIAIALARHGCAALAIENRTSERAEVLAAAVAKAFPECAVTAKRQEQAAFDLVINATSCGMRPGDPSPLSRERLARAGLVAECVVAQEMTPLLQIARDLGRPTHPGLPMLEAQIELMVRFMGVPG